MEIAHPLFLMKVYSKFEISEKTVIKNYSLERPRRTRNITIPLGICVKVLQRELGIQISFNNCDISLSV